MGGEGYDEPIRSNKVFFQGWTLPVILRGRKPGCSRIDTSWIYLILNQMVNKMWSYGQIV